MNQQFQSSHTHQLKESYDFAAYLIDKELSLMAWSTALKHLKTSTSASSSSATLAVTWVASLKTQATQRPQINKEEPQFEL